MVKNGVELLAEACKSDASYLMENDIATVIAEAKEQLTSITDLDETIPMTPEMIPVQKKGEYYYVDFSGVQTVAMDMDADIGQIMGEIIKVNSDGKDNILTPKNLILTIESADYFNELIQEAKCGNKRAKGILSKATDTIKNLKKAGIKVQKKKSKNRK